MKSIESAIHTPEDHEISLIIEYSTIFDLTIRLIFPEECSSFSVICSHTVIIAPTDDDIILAIIGRRCMGIFSHRIIVFPEGFTSFDIDRYDTSSLPPESELESDIYDSSLMIDTRG